MAVIGIVVPGMVSLIGAGRPGRNWRYLLLAGLRRRDRRRHRGRRPELLCRPALRSAHPRPLALLPLLAAARMGRGVFPPVRRLERRHRPLPRTQPRHRPTGRRDAADAPAALLFRQHRLGRGPDPRLLPARLGPRDLAEAGRGSRPASCRPRAAPGRRPGARLLARPPGLSPARPPRQQLAPAVAALVRPAPDHGPARPRPGRPRAPGCACTDRVRLSLDSGCPCWSGRSPA